MRETKGTANPKKVNEVLEKKYAYTSMEKFEKLNAKNPNVDVLRKTFNLDI